MNLILVIFDGEINNRKSGIEDRTSQLTAEKFNLLLVEDNKQNLAYLNKELKSSYHIYRASNSSETFKTLSMQHIDLILIKNNAEDIEGNAFCRHIKTSRIFKHIPIILLTDKEDVDDRIEGLKSGLDAFIEEPFSIEYLKAQIQNILFNRQIIQKHFSNDNHHYSIGIAHDGQINQFINKIYTIIEANLTESNFTVEELAKLMNMSRATLYRKVKEYSTFKPNEMILYSKLYIASKLLTRGIYTVSQVATMVGYSLQSNFSRDFRKHFGIQPSLFIKHYLV